MSITAGSQTFPVVLPEVRLLPKYLLGGIAGGLFWTFIHIS